MARVAFCHVGLNVVPQKAPGFGHCALKLAPVSPRIADFQTPQAYCSTVTRHHTMVVVVYFEPLALLLNFFQNDFNSICIAYMYSTIF